MTTVKHIQLPKEDIRSFRPGLTETTPAFVVYRDTSSHNAVLTAMCTWLNRIARVKDRDIKWIRKIHGYDAALDAAFVALSDRFPGVYFGLISTTEVSATYGWLPNDKPQGETI